MNRALRPVVLTLGAGWVLAAAGPARAQEVYGPSDEEETDGSAPTSMLEARPCEEEVRDDGTIIVCRELEDQERYMSPLPRPVDGNRGIFVPPDISTLPPCVHNPPWQFCASGLGPRTQPVPMVDLSAIPEPLSDEEAAQVFRADDGHRIKLGNGRSWAAKGVDQDDRSVGTKFDVGSGSDFDGFDGHAELTDHRQQRK